MLALTNSDSYIGKRYVEKKYMLACFGLLD